MRDGWTLTTLGDVAQLVMGQSPPGSSYNALGEGLPFLQGSAEFGERHPTPVKWCTAPKKIARPGDLLVSVRAPVGSLNFADQELSIGRGLALVRGRGDTTTEFLALALEYGIADLLARSGGGMFSSITGSALASLPMALPPHHEQRRIVDLVAALDEVVTDTRSTIEQLQRTLTAALSELARVEGSAVSLGDLVKMSSGPSWKAKQEGTTPAPGAIPVLKITNTRPDGRVVVGDPAFVSGLPPKTMRLDSSCLVVIRTNGNRARIGNVYRVPAQAEGHAVSAFQIAMKPHDPSDTDYLYCFLSSPSVQAAISAAASGTTGLGNIGIGWLKELAIPWAAPEIRAAIISRASAVTAEIDAAEREHAALVDLRTALLADLLSGAHEIPESYDRFLESA